MFSRIKSLAQSVAAFHKYWFNRALTEPDINSRLVFLLHGGVSALGTLVLSIAFIFAKQQEHYEHMILALGGSTAGSAIGRYFTKKNGGDPGAAPPSPDPAAVPPPQPTAAAVPPSPQPPTY
jgi:hypothetical protein